MPLPAEPLGRKAGQTVTHAEHLAQLGGGVDMRHPRRRKEGPGLLEQLAVGGLTTEGDPIEPHPADGV